MNNAKREELEKACKKEKNHKIQTRMITVRIVRARNISMDDTVDILIRCPNWVRNRLRRYDEGGLEGLRDLPRCGRPRSIKNRIRGVIISRTSGSGITPARLQQQISEEVGVRLHITYVRKIIHAYDLSPKAPKKVHINMASKKAVRN